MAALPIIAEEIVRSKLMFYNVLTTSINTTHIKPFAVPKQFPRESSEARPIVQTLGVIWPYVIVTQSSESAQCRLDLHLLEAGKFHSTYASRATKATPWNGPSQPRGWVVSTT
jgi:hypothetical protein